MYDTHFIENEKSKVGINPEGGYVTSWKYKTKNNHWKDILYRGSTIRRTGIPVLFPYYGKAKEMRMHGFGRDSEWKITHLSGTSATMELQSKDISSDAVSEYPFLFKACINITVESDSLVYSLTVTNLDSTLLPISPGIHPYWSIPHDKKNTIHATNLEGFEPQKIDWESSPPDIPFRYTAPVEAILDTTHLKIESVNNAVKYIQIWSQTPVRDPDYDFICIEPIGGLNYGIDEKPVLVAPHTAWNMTIKFTVIDA